MKSSGFEFLSKMKYPGRFIIMGSDPTGNFSVVAYGLTGRSASSQARKLEGEDGTVWTKPLDPEILKTGNPELLIYPAVIIQSGLAVSNGRQTTDIAGRMAFTPSPQEALSSALKAWDYEPDSPIFTPRLSGCLFPDGRAALSIIRRAVRGGSIRDIYEVPAVSGGGRFMATYRGGDKDPILAWEGGPQEVKLEQSSAAELAAAVFEALAPQVPGADYRVACAALFIRRDAPQEVSRHIINRRERI
jgi:IMP cyclohydrolase